MLGDLLKSVAMICTIRTNAARVESVEYWCGAK